MYYYYQNNLKVWTYKFSNICFVVMFAFSQFCNSVTLGFQHAWETVRWRTVEWYYLKIPNYLVINAGMFWCIESIRVGGPHWYHFTCIRYSSFSQSINKNTSVNCITSLHTGCIQMAKTVKTPPKMWHLFYCS